MATITLKATGTPWPWSNDGSRASLPSDSRREKSVNVVLLPEELLLTEKFLTVVL